jgi:hypothetical protein
MKQTSKIFPNKKKFLYDSFIFLCECKYAQFCDDLKHGCGSDIDRNCRKLLVKDKERLAKILKKMQKQAAAAKKNKDKGKQKSKSPKKKNNQT